MTCVTHAMDPKYRKGVPNSRLLNEDKVNYASAMLTECALTWWDATFESLTENECESLTWESFKTPFFEQFCLIDLQWRLEKEFVELKQAGNIYVIEYGLNLT